MPGSSFQGADGNQNDAAPRVDWQGLQAAGRVRHTADANDEDTAFTGGSKEDVPGEWDFRTEGDGVTPGKANILDAWTAVDQDGADVRLSRVRACFRGGHSCGDDVPHLRALSHDARLWNNGQAMIPCRRTGDILISYEPPATESTWCSSGGSTGDDLGPGAPTRGHLDGLTG